MNFAFTEEQEELARTVRRFCEERSPLSEVRRLMETTEGWDSAVWSQMGKELGLQGLAIPEAYGGAGFTFVELVVVLEQMGRSLLCAPFLSSVCLAANAVLNAGSEDDKAELLPGLASGEVTGTVAFTEPSGRWDAAGITMEGRACGDGARGPSGPLSGKSSAGFTLSGTKTFVLDGHTAGLLVVAARAPGTTGPDGVSLFVVDPAADGLTRTPLPTLDQTRKQARLDFAGVPARLLGREGAGWPALALALDQVAVALAAEQVGGAQACLDMSVAYAKERVQFGRPIGSFQAIKHKCADMLLEVESARSAAYYGGWAAAESPDELPVVAAIAKAYCSEAYFHAAAENIQIHGGIGFTWEHDAHLYFKRAKSSEILFGDPAYHRELLAQRIGI